MTRWNSRLVFYAVVAGVALGCNRPSEEQAAIAPGTEVVAATASAPAPPPRPPGLVESNEAIAGFKLPEGITVLLREDRRLLALVPASVAETRRYVGERVFSGRVTPLGSEGVVYYNSIVRAARGGAVHMDIMVSQTPRGTELNIVELPPPQTRALTPEDLEAIARREMTEGR